MQRILKEKPSLFIYPLLCLPISHLTIHFILLNSMKSPAVIPGGKSPSDMFEGCMSIAARLQTCAPCLKMCRVIFFHSSAGMNVSPIHQKSSRIDAVAVSADPRSCLEEHRCHHWKSACPGDSHCFLLSHTQA